MGLGQLQRRLPRLDDPRAMSRISSGTLTGALFLAALAISHVLLSRLGLQMFLVTLVALFFASIYATISFRSLSVPFYMTVLSIGGFRFIWSIQAPVLPDLYLDRMMLIWLMVVFMVKFFAERRKPIGPYHLDLAILAHGTYTLIRIIMNDMTYFHPWSMSVLVPYLTYFFAKNIIQNEKQIRNLLLVLTALGVYYSITSIAEKFHMTQLLWPKYMAVPHEIFVGRSSGPFRNSGIFGNVLGMLIPINLYFITMVRHKWVKLILMCNMAVGFAGLYFTYTRGSWLAGVTALIAVAVLNWRNYLKTLLPLALVVPFIALFFLGLGQDKFMKERVETEGTIGSRIGTAVTALRVWRDHPFLGVGSFRYPQVREDYIEPVEVPGMPTIRFVQFRRNAIHDMYLGPLAEDGLVGTVLQFTIYFIILRVFLRKFSWRKDGDPFARYVMPLFAGIFLSYLIGGLTISYRHVSMLGTLFYMAAGILDGYNPQVAATETQSTRKS